MLGHHTKISFLFSFVSLFESIVGHELSNGTSGDCNLNYNVDQLLDNIDNIEGKYAEARKAFHGLLGGSGFDDKMLQDMLGHGGAAVRTLYKHSSEHSSIPAGLNLGGHVIMRLERTILTFYRMMVRNNTVFQVDRIQNDFEAMTLNAVLQLNELHLMGSFSSCQRRRKSRRAFDYFLTCRHKYGQVELLMSNVRYRLQGRYRLLQDKLKLEHIVSKLDIEHMGVSLPNRRWSSHNSNDLAEESVWRSSLDEFVVRLKTDLDQWMLDYFNDYLMYFVDIEDQPEVLNNFQQYEVERTKIANDFVDNTIDVLTNRLRHTHQACPQIPDYTLTPSTLMSMIELIQGQLIGLDSMYRRSVATTSPGGDSREINAVVGFSNIKVFYSYELVRNKHPYKGLIVLTADDVTAQLSIKLNKSPKRRNDYKQVAVKLKILKVAESNFLTVRGMGILPSLKSLLDKQIKSIMADAIVKAIKNLGSAASCEPTILVTPFTYDPNSDNNTLTDDENGDYDEDAKNI